MSEKKDFKGALRKTSADQKKVMEDRFAKADSVFLGMKPAEAVAPAHAPAKAPAKRPPKVAPLVLAVATPPSMAPADDTPAGDHVIRDTFSMPPAEHQLIEQLRVRAAKEGRNTGKSEVVRAGLKALMDMKPAQLAALLNGLQKVKPGRR